MKKSPSARSLMIAEIAVDLLVIAGFVGMLLLGCILVTGHLPLV